MISYKPLRNILRDRYIKRWELALGSKVGLSTIERLCAENADTTLGTLLKIANYLDVSVCDLFEEVKK